MSNYSMEFKAFIGISIFILIVFLFVLIFLREKLPYQSAESILTNTEHKFYRTLIRCVPDGCMLFCKVRFADFIGIKKGSKNWRKYINKILAKHADFLICDEDTLRPLLVIELDDSSHNIEANIIRDMEKDKILKAAQIPILRVKTEKNYDIRWLREEIYESLKQ